MWIDSDYDSWGMRIGDNAFLVEVKNTSNGAEYMLLQESPLRTNQSREPRLTGWCGETDNRSRYARGMVRIVKYNKSGDRAFVRQLTHKELATALEERGYPELIPELEKVG